MLQSICKMSDESVFDATFDLTRSKTSGEMNDRPRRLYMICRPAFQLGHKDVNLEFDSAAVSLTHVEASPFSANGFHAFSRSLSV